MSNWLKSIAPRMAAQGGLRPVAGTPQPANDPVLVSKRDQRVHRRAELARTYAGLLGSDVLVSDLEQSLLLNADGEGFVDAASLAEAIAATGLLSVVEPVKKLESSLWPALAE